MVQKTPNGTRRYSVALVAAVPSLQNPPILQWQLRFERLPNWFLPDSLKTRVLRHYLRVEVDELCSEVREGPVDYSEEWEAYDSIVAGVGIDPASLDPLPKRDVERIITAFAVWFSQRPEQGSGKRRRKNGPTLDEIASDLGALLVKRWQQRLGNEDSSGDEPDWYKDGASEALHRWPRNGPRKYDGSW